jgi:phosphatidylserine synthase 2
MSPFDKLYLGYRVKRFLVVNFYQEYYWRGLYEIPTYRGKIKRIIAQFSPHGWIEFQWNPLSSVERWIAIICIIGVFLVTGVSIIFTENRFPDI